MAQTEKEIIDEIAKKTSEIVELVSRLPKNKRTILTAVVKAMVAIVEGIGGRPPKKPSPSA